MGPLLRPHPAAGRRADRPRHGRLLLRRCLLRDRPAGTARILGDDDEVTTANFSRFGRTLGASPGQRTTACADNESRAC